MTVPVVGPSTQLFSTPYLTVDEYKNAPTSVDIDDLVDDGDVDAQDVELANVIARASSWMDTYCFQVLAATTQTELVPARIGRNGVLTIHPKFFPIRSVSAISYGAPGDDPQPIDFSSASISVWPKKILVSRFASTLGTLAGCNVFVTLTYVAGYPNTVLTADADGFSIDVQDATGIVGGDYLGIYDTADSGTYVVQVDPAWVPTTGPTAVAIVGDIGAGVSGSAVSGLPPAVKQAAINVVNAFLKGRGSTAIEMRAATEPTGGSVPPDPAGPDMADAKAALIDFRRVR